MEDGEEEMRVISAFARHECTQRKREINEQTNKMEREKKSKRKEEKRQELEGLEV